MLVALLNPFFPFFSWCKDGESLHPGSDQKLLYPAANANSVPLGYIASFIYFWFVFFLLLPIPLLLLPAAAEKENDATWCHKLKWDWQTRSDSALARKVCWFHWANESLLTVMELITSFPFFLSLFLVFFFSFFFFFQGISVIGKKGEGGEETTDHNFSRHGYMIWQGRVVSSYKAIIWTICSTVFWCLLL